MPVFSSLNSGYSIDNAILVLDILYVHTDGKIAPCCGYANENSALIIGTIDDDYETLVKNAESNQMTQICFVQGLENWRKTELKKQKKSATENATIKFREKTLSACTLCDFVCKNQRTNEKA